MSVKFARDDRDDEHTGNVPFSRLRQLAEQVAKEATEDDMDLNSNMGEDDDEDDHHDMGDIYGDEQDMLEDSFLPDARHSNAGGGGSGDRRESDLPGNPFAGTFTFAAGAGGKRGTRQRGVKFVGRDSTASAHGGISGSRKSSVIKRKRSLFASVSEMLMDHSTFNVPEDMRRRSTHRMSIADMQNRDVQRLSAGELRKDVKQRAMRRHKAQQDEKEAIVRRTERRAMVAESRRQFLETMRESQSACMWNAVMCAMAFAMRLQHTLDTGRSYDVLTLKLLPMIRLKVHRLRRKHKLREVITGIARPTVSMLNNDKMFGYFSYNHISAVIPLFRPVYFDKGDVVVYQGAEGNEAYCIARGEADVFVNKNYVVTMRKDDVFGTLGMISGEPRMATVKAKTELICWTIDRSAFLSVGKRIDERTLKHAMAIVTELHESNIVGLYPHLLLGAQLRRFHLMSGMPVELLDMLIPPRPTKDHQVNWGEQVMEPKAFKAGDTLYTKGERVKATAYVLRGKVKLTISMNDIGEGKAWKSIEEVTAFHCDIFEMARTERHDRDAYYKALADRTKGDYYKAMYALGLEPQDTPPQQQTSSVPRSRRSTVASQAAAAANAERKKSMAAPAAAANLQSQMSLQTSINMGSPVSPDEYVIGPIPAQALLCMPHVIFNEPCSCTITAVTSVDVMLMKKERLLSYLMQEPASLYAMRKAANSIHASSLTPASRMTILNGMFGAKNMAQSDHLVHLRYAHTFPSAEPVVLDVAETVNFTKRDPTVLLIARGTLDDPTELLGSELPAIWPPLYLTYFGNYSMTVKVTERIEGYRLKRAEIVELLSYMKKENFDQQLDHMAKQYHRKVGKKAVFESLHNYRDDDVDTGNLGDMGFSDSVALSAQASLQLMQPHGAQAHRNSGLFGAAGALMAMESAANFSMEGDNMLIPPHEGMSHSGQFQNKWMTRPLDKLPRRPENTVMDAAIQKRVDAMRKTMQKKKQSDEAERKALTSAPTSGRASPVLHSEGTAVSTAKTALLPTQTFLDVDLTAAIEVDRRNAEREGLRDASALEEEEAFMQLTQSGAENDADLALGRSETPQRHHNEHSKDGGKKRESATSSSGRPVGEFSIRSSGVTMSSPATSRGNANLSTIATTAHQLEDPRKADRSQTNRSPSPLLLPMLPAPGMSHERLWKTVGEATATSPRPTTAADAVVGTIEDPELNPYVPKPPPTALLLARDVEMPLLPLAKPVNSTFRFGAGGDTDEAEPDLFANKKIAKALATVTPAPPHEASAATARGGGRRPQPPSSDRHHGVSQTPRGLTSGLPVVPSAQSRQDGNMASEAVTMVRSWTADGKVPTTTALQHMNILSGTSNGRTVTSPNADHSRPGTRATAAGHPKMAPPRAPGGGTVDVTRTFSNGPSRASSRKGSSSAASMAVPLQHGAQPLVRQQQLDLLSGIVDASPFTPQSLQDTLLGAGSTPRMVDRPKYAQPAAGSLRNNAVGSLITKAPSAIEMSRPAKMKALAKDREQAALRAMGGTTVSLLSGKKEAANTAPESAASKSNRYAPKFAASRLEHSKLQRRLENLQVQNKVRSVGINL